MGVVAKFTPILHESALTESTVLFIARPNTVQWMALLARGERQ
jgi:hypothetical protein